MKFLMNICWRNECSILSSLHLYLHWLRKGKNELSLNALKVKQMQFKRKGANIGTNVWHAYVFFFGKAHIKNGIWHLCSISVHSSYMDERKIKWVLQEETETLLCGSLCFVSIAVVISPYKPSQFYPHFTSMTFNIKSNRHTSGSTPTFQSCCYEYTKDK